jgi:hypothetical protein
VFLSFGDQEIVGGKGADRIDLTADQRGDLPGGLIEPSVSEECHDILV